MKKAVTEYLSEIGRRGGKRVTDKKRKANAQNARGTCRVRECLMCGWKGKKRVKGRCRDCGAAIN